MTQDLFPVTECDQKPWILRAAFRNRGLDHVAGHDAGRAQRMAGSREQILFGAIRSKICYFLKLTERLYRGAEGLVVAPAVAGALLAITAWLVVLDFEALPMAVVVRRRFDVDVSGGVAVQADGTMTAVGRHELLNICGGVPTTVQKGLTIQQMLRKVARFIIASLPTRVFLPVTLRRDEGLLQGPDQWVDVVMGALAVFDSATLVGHPDRGVGGLPDAEGNGGQACGGLSANWHHDPDRVIDIFLGTYTARCATQRASAGRFLTCASKVAGESSISGSKFRGPQIPLAGRQ